MTGDPGPGGVGNGELGVGRVGSSGENGAPLGFIVVAAGQALPAMVDSST
ncbi:hypothetical protein TOK_1043 [Pseudonocardia sp. N23]|nr:hypothetical protein TOK_1043 [Pseudonocardia sp. N23]